MNFTSFIYSLINTKVKDKIYNKKRVKYIKKNIKKIDVKFEKQ